MSSSTTNYNWNVPTYEDEPDIKVISDTIEDIDEEVKDKEDNININRAELMELVDGGAKNVLENTAQDGTSSTVSFVVNNDKSITASGTATGGAAQRRIATISADEAQSFNGLILSGCPEGGLAGGYRLVFQLDGNPYTSYAADRGSGATISGVPAQQCRVMLVLEENKTADNLIFKPMICSQAAWAVSKAYTPYRPSYQELYERILALEGGTVLQRKAIVNVEEGEEK